MIEDADTLSSTERGKNNATNWPKYMLAKNRPCMDCKLTWHPAVMTLDHRNRSTKHITKDGKRLDPSAMMHYPPHEFDKMLSYCDAVCSNCHKIREMRRDHTAFIAKWKMFSYRLTKGALMREDSDG